MCIRFVRARPGPDYVSPLMSGPCDSRPADEIRPSWNIAPGTVQPVIYPAGVTRCVRWGYRGRRSAGKRLRTIMDAAVGGAAGSMWAPCWREGRVIVPCDGWFEWLPQADGSQPYFIRRLDAEPLFMAAVTTLCADDDVRDDDGFMIVVAPAGNGVVDRHARRPVVFAAPDARAWIDAHTTPEQASRLVHRGALPADAFLWFPVSRAVNRAGTQDGPALIARAASRI
ncbi:protein of unknown function DUF159 [Burkholderia sp. lig30]|uniref:SOS response-associated peptidase family protein n=1 Tax=Burkholderia sp. lig30 TaxID=1192124 RepID=UPI000460AD5C|nr:SOS response-associated peptidase family protein [Burkholderia sp. lig30]KDB08975.1 protein of unknown function DUF159 [Burkholderia sp. lig30]